MKKYDYLIVGAGLFGAVCAHELNKRGKSVLIIDKNSYIGGLCHDSVINDIPVHTYGPHIFHTSKKYIWDYISQFADFNCYRHKVVVNYRGKIFSFPINLMTLYQLWGVSNPRDAISTIDSKRQIIDAPSNLEEWILSRVGDEIYDIFFKEYTEKQWGKKCTELPISIVDRIPIRYTFNDYYYNDCDIYSGTPRGGYTSIFEKMLSGCEIRLGVDYIDDRKHLDGITDCVIYTGEIDRLYKYIYGPLEYRSVRYEYDLLDIADYQGVGQVNFTDMLTPYTRVIEYKHLHNIVGNSTVIAKEFVSDYNNTNPSIAPAYPINTKCNNNLYEQYFKLISHEHNMYIGGRLANYQYYNMDKIICDALDMVARIL